MKDLIDKTRKFVKKETDQYPTSNRTFIEISNDAGQKLAEIYKADKNIVLLGTLLMDLKIDQAYKENKLNDHVRMSIKASQKFLDQEKVDLKIINKVLHCIEAHHGTIPYLSQEAEIVANADCYRFLTIKGLLSFIKSLQERNLEDQKIKEFIKAKTQEKWNVLSLPEAKADLEENYLLFQELIKL